VSKFAVPFAVLVALTVGAAAAAAMLLRPRDAKPGMLQNVLGLVALFAACVSMVLSFGVGCCWLIGWH